jgi:hypothetical protein
MDRFQGVGGSMNLDGEQITVLLALTSNRNLAFNLIMNVSRRVIYGL